jgi:plastocyanin domain-containing protein
MMKVRTSSKLGLIWIIMLVTCACSGKGPNSPVATVAATDKGTIQEIKIDIKGEYVPSQVSVVKGKPLRMVFRRNDNLSCTEYVILEDFRIKQKLEPYRETAFELMPDREGEFPFVCGMGMLHGKLIVR